MGRDLPVSLEEAANAVHKTPRWLNEFLLKNPVNLIGEPLYRLAGRDKLVYVERLIEALPCPSNSSRRAPAKRRSTRSGAPISDATLTEALLLATSGRRKGSSRILKTKSNVESFQEAKDKKDSRRLLHHT